MKKGEGVCVCVCINVCVMCSAGVAGQVRDHGSVTTKPEQFGYCYTSWNASARARKVAAVF